MGQCRKFLWVRSFQEMFFAGWLMWSIWERMICQMHIWVPTPVGRSMDDDFLNRKTYQHIGYHILVTQRGVHWHNTTREIAYHRSLDSRKSLKWITTSRKQDQCISSRHKRIHRAIVLCSWYLHRAKEDLMWWVVHRKAIKQIWEIMYRCTPRSQVHREEEYMPTNMHSTAHQWEIFQITRDT